MRGVRTALGALLVVCALIAVAAASAKSDAVAKKDKEPVAKHATGDPFGAPLARGRHRRELRALSVGELAPDRHLKSAALEVGAHGERRARGWSRDLEAEPAPEGFQVVLHDFRL